MGSCYYTDPPINTSVLPYIPPPPDYFTASTKEFCSPFVSSFPPEDNWTYGDPPINTSILPYIPPPRDYFSASTKEFCPPFVSSFSPEDNWTYGDPPIRDALIVSMPCEGGLSESCADADGNKPTDDTLYGEDTGGAGAAAEYHTCEELSGCGNCGNACCSCAEADYFARKCTLGADCEWSGHHSGGNSSIQCVV